MPYTPVSYGTGRSSRGTRTLPYAYWVSECQSERAPALGENASCSCVLDCSRERYSRHNEPEWERLKEYPERAECNVVKKSSFLPFWKIRVALTHQRFGTRRTVESRILPGLLFAVGLLKELLDEYDVLYNLERRAGNLRVEQPTVDRKLKVRLQSSFNDPLWTVCRTVKGHHCVDGYVDTSNESTSLLFSTNTSHWPPRYMIQGWTNLKICSLRKNETKVAGLFFYHSHPSVVETANPIEV